MGTIFFLVLVAFFIWYFTKQKKEKEARRQALEEFNRRQAQEAMQKNQQPPQYKEDTEPEPEPDHSALLISDPEEFKGLSSEDIVPPLGRPLAAEPAQEPAAPVLSAEELEEQKKKIKKSMNIKIKRLEGLLASGDLTEEEFEEEKNRIRKKAKIKIKKLEMSQSSQDGAPADMPADVRQALREGSVLLAVKLYKDHTGCSLLEAKEYIDAHKQSFQ